MPKVVSTFGAAQGKTPYIEKPFGEEKIHQMLLTLLATPKVTSQTQYQRTNFGHHSSA
jgi:hypothetical protein